MKFLKCRVDIDCTKLSCPNRHTDEHFIPIRYADTNCFAWIRKGQIIRYLSNANDIPTDMIKTTDLASTLQLFSTIKSVKPTLKSNPLLFASTAEKIFLCPNTFADADKECPDMNTCKFAHGEEELKITDVPTSYKIYRCVYNLNCPNRPICKDIHTDEKTTRYERWWAVWMKGKIIRFLNTRPINLPPTSASAEVEHYIYDFGSNDWKIKHLKIQSVAIAGETPTK